MPIGRIRTRSTFTTLRQDGRRARSGALRVTHVPDSPTGDARVPGSPTGDARVPGSPTGDARVAFAISRAVGTAVVRNRVRRRLRAACAELSPPAGAYLVTATPPAAGCTYAELRDDLALALAQLAPNEAQP